MYALAKADTFVKQARTNGSILSVWQAADETAVRKVQNYLQGQAMLNAALQTPNLSAAVRAAVKEQAQRRGIGAALGLLGGLAAAAAERVRRQQERAEQRAARKAKQIEAEMQALSALPQAWKAAAQAYLAQKAWASFRAQERASVSSLPKEQPKRWWQRAWDAITHPVQTLQNTLVQWGMRSPAGYKIIGGLAHFTAGLNDPERNPVTASFGKALRDGWAGFSYGVRSTLDLTYKTGASLLKGNWEGVKRYGGALLEGTLKGWLWGGIQTAGQLVWGGIKMATPIGLFETGPAWWSAIKDAWAGRRGGWDVVFTSLLLMANVIGMAGSVNGVQTQATRTALVREYGEAVRPLLADKEVIPLLKNGELAPKPWREYVPPREWPAFDGEGVAVKLNDMATVYRYWGGDSPELGRWATIHSNLRPGEAQELLALPNTNPATNTEFGIPKDVVVIVGRAASQIGKDWAGPYAAGGGIQIYIPDSSVLIRFP